MSIDEKVNERKTFYIHTGNFEAVSDGMTLEEVGLAFQTLREGAAAGELRGPFAACAILPLDGGKS